MMTEVTCKNTQVSTYGITKVASIPEIIGLYLGVPLALLLVYLLPAGIKAQFFTLHLEHPMILSLLTNAFSHDLASHLTANLMYYAVAISAILVLETNIRRFRYALASTLVAVPVLASAATLVYFQGSGIDHIVGFSGVVSGLLGYLIYLIVERMHSVTPMHRPHAFVMWISTSALIVFATAIAIGAVTLYQVGHLSNGVGHLVGYVAGIILAYSLRTL